MTTTATAGIDASGAKGATARKAARRPRARARDDRDEAAPVPDAARPEPTPADWAAAGTTCGIDPGGQGALVWVRNSRIVAIRDMPTIMVRVGQTMRPRVTAHGLVRLFRALPAEAYFLEDNSGRPKNGSTTGYTFGRSSGLVEGVAAALDIPLQAVGSQRWKKAMTVNRVKTKSRIEAMRVFPEWAGSFERVRDDGRAEAALIALYGEGLKRKQGLLGQ